MAMALQLRADQKSHEKVCAERYWWILLWVKTTAGIVGLGTCALVGALWQVIVHLGKLS